MRTFNNISNGEAGLSVRGKLNNALTSVIAGSEGINAIWAKINSVISMVNAMEGGIGGLIKDTSYDPASLDPYKSAVLIALCTGTFYKLKDKNGTPITIPGSNAITVFYRAANTTYWEYDTQEIFPAVDSYEDTDYSKIESANTHVLTHGGTAIAPMTNFESVYDAEGNNLNVTFEKLRAVARGTISVNELDTLFYNSGLYLVTYAGESGEIDPLSMGLLEVFCDSGQHITHQRLICNLDDPNRGYYLHSDGKSAKVWTRRYNLTAPGSIIPPRGTWSRWELIENFTPELLEKLNGIEEGAQVNHTLVWDGDNGDLDVSDENGNVILRLKNGHLYVQKFRSDNTLSTENLQIRTELSDDETGNRELRLFLIGYDSEGELQEYGPYSLPYATEESEGTMSAEDKRHLERLDTTDGDEADLDISDNEGNAIARFKNGHIQTQKFNSETDGQTSVLDGENADLDVSDEQGNVIARFSGGEFQTKNFDSTKTPAQTEDNSTAEFQIADEEGNTIAEFNKGNFRTKEFDSRMVQSQEGTEDSDLDITDPEGNVLTRFKNGHVQVQNFNSENPFSAEIVKTEDERTLAKFGSLLARVIITKRGRRVAIVTNGFVENKILYV